MAGSTYFDALKGYVEFDENSTELLRAFHPLAQSEFATIIDDFYAVIQRHPGARAAITGGAAQIDRLKGTLVTWLHEMLRGPHDEPYFNKRARIGRVHVRIGLPQSYMLTAMNRIRVQLADVARERLADDPVVLEATSRALHQIMDLELAIMLETYREDLLVKNRTAERLSTIGQFAAGIGHELRNPLGVIESSVYLMRQHLARDPADPRIGRHLDKIAAEVTRSGNTITQLLELARNRQAQRRPSSLAALVSAATTTSHLPKGVVVTVHAPPDDELSLNVDPDQLVRVLSNLFTNASQATNGAGHIDVIAVRSAGAVQLCVRDDGPGIPVDVSHRIFEALFTTKAKGTGLGLALCRRIVEAHGGTIVLEPSEKGASFVISLPDLAESSEPS